MWKVCNKQQTKNNIQLDILVFYSFSLRIQHVFTQEGCIPLSAMADIYFLLSFSFGMKHDGIHNKCELKDEDEFMYVMSSHLLVASASMKWSPCSKKEITKFVE